MSQGEVICQAQLRVWDTGTPFVVIQPWDPSGRIWSVLEEGEVCWYEAAILRRDSVVLAGSSPDEVSSGKCHPPEGIICQDAPSYFADQSLGLDSKR